MKKIAGIIVVIGVFLLINTASAHVVVKPAEVAPGAFQTFTVGVPVELDSPTIGLKLVIPEGLQHVTPNVKPGWKINIKKTSDAVTEISWTGGSIPAGQRDEFMFSAQAPVSTSTIVWKAYQTYRNGMVVAWDQDPEASGENIKPYSKTEVAGTYTEVKDITPVVMSANSISLLISVAALAVSIWAITRTQQKNS